MSPILQPTSEQAAGASGRTGSGCHLDPDAVESAGAFVANGLAANAGGHEPDPDWQPL